MTRVREHSDDTVMENWDDTGMENCDEKSSGAL